ncbi:MAG: electron transfer flavoprotein subunit beta/FixA family protein [Dehalococcoidales bacterium]|nr:electron transfer flavoprotein subunit beta/FixA family protein [Dehalococcoidales bacterium]
MNMIVCCKQVVDPEAPPASFRVDAATNKVVPPNGIPPVISPFDENALEAALKIKDAQGGKITVISLGSKLLRDVVKKPLSMGADELVLLEDEAYDEGDSYAVASAIAKAIEKIGEYDLVFCGRQAADWDNGQVGAGIAELLGIPCVTLAKKVEPEDGKVKVERVTPDGYDVIEASLPALVTVSNELGEARYPTIKGIMAAKKKEPTVWKPEDIGVDPSQLGASGRRSKLMKLFQPVREGTCEMIEGESPEETAQMLAMKLREEKVI